MELNGPKRLTVYNPASYQISIQGHLPRSWHDRVGGMTVSTRGNADRDPVTTLSGQLLDQAALMGVLNTMYLLGLPLLSVECTSIP